MSRRVSHDVCVPLSPTVDVRVVGGKAAGLARVAALGFHVPPGIVVSRTAFRQAIDVSGLEPDLADYCRSLDHESHEATIERHRQLVSRLHAARLPLDVESSVRDSINQLLENAPAGLAVRSSALYEDADRASFAGVFESFIGIRDPDAARRAVVDCWGSSWSPRAMRYLVRNGIEPVFDAMAVLMQKAVPARAAGVICTANPTDGNPFQFVLHATHGLAVDILSGSGVGDRSVLDWADGYTINERKQGSHAVLSPTAKATLARVALRLDEAFSKRLDIEWALADELWIVQARPLVALPDFLTPEMRHVGRDRSWQLASFVLPLRTDHPPAFLTPLYADLSESELWYRHQPHDIVLTGIWRHQLDLNGYRYVDTEALPTFFNYFASPAEFEPWLERNEPTYRGRWETRYAEVAGLAAEAEDAILHSKRAIELIPTMLSVRDRFWDLNSFAWSGPQSLGWMCEALLGGFLRDIGLSVKPSDLDGGGLSHTFSLALALQELGQSIQERDVIAAFEVESLSNVLPTLRASTPGSEFLARYDAICWRFGRTPLTWLDRPAFWRTSTRDEDISSMWAVRAAFRRESRDVGEVRRRSSAACHLNAQRVREHFRPSDPRIRRFERMLEWFRYWAQALNDRHGLAAGLLWERELIWHVGARLVSEGLLREVADVVALRADDLAAYAKGGDERRLRTACETRIREHRANRRLRPPAKLGAIVPAGTASLEAGAGDPTSARTLRGIGFGRGHATGRARIVRALDARVLDRLTSDDVLVVTEPNAFAYADWHSLLMGIKGVVSASQPAHHLTQVAREVGVPIVGHLAARAMQIQEDEELYVDAHLGVVVRKAPSG